MSNKLYLFLLLPLFVCCGSGDDDGSRLGEQIVGTWYRGWEEGDVEIIGGLDGSWFGEMVGVKARLKLFTREREEKNWRW